jgi:hypothetical protein
MAITIINKSDDGFIITQDKIQDGKAYMDTSGDIYIGNKSRDIIAFSICGSFIVHDFSEARFREVNLTITVE